MQPIRDPQQQLEADRQSRRRMMQAWLTLFVIVALAALKIWGHHETRELLQDEAQHPPLQTGPWFLWAAVFPAICFAMVATRGFTFSFGKPIWRWLELRLMLCQVALILCAVFAMMPLQAELGARLGLPGDSTLALLVPLAAIVWGASQLLIAAVCRSALIERLRAKGVGDLLGQGTLVVLKRLPRGVQRDRHDFDAGQLWMEGSLLRFEGDSLSLRTEPGGAVKLTREVVPGTLGGLIGQKGIILTLPPETNASEVSVRPIGAMPGQAREATERLALEMAPFTV